MTDANPKELRKNKALGSMVFKNCELKRKEVAIEVDLHIRYCCSHVTVGAGKENH